MINSWDNVCFNWMKVNSAPNRTQQPTIFHIHQQAASRIHMIVKWVLSKNEISAHNFENAHTGPQGSLGIPRKSYFNLFLGIPFGIFGIFGQILRLLIKITWFLSFSSKNDAESLCHFVKIPIFGPETCQIGPKLWLPSCPDLLLTP